jgi:indolepyruvate ferredoxin oxidoreductase, beta subunit
MAGVGGQGTILAAGLLAHVLVKHGFDVKTSEVHGMAQRGGNVVGMIRFGEKVASPLVPFGEAEAIIATELLEALRNINYLSDKGVVIGSRTRVDPLPVLQGVAEYPKNAEEEILRLAPGSLVVDAQQIAVDAGDARAANTVLLGILSRNLPVEMNEWLEVIAANVPAKAVDVNNKAFLAGRDIL